MPYCISRHTADIKTRKVKKLKQSSEKKIEKVRSKTEEEKGERKESLEPNANMELEKGEDRYQDEANSNPEESFEPDKNKNLETKSWAANPPELERFERSNDKTEEVYVESQNHIMKFSC